MFPLPFPSERILVSCSHIEGKWNHWLLPPTKHLCILALNHEPTILEWGRDKSNSWKSITHFSYSLTVALVFVREDLRQSSLSLNFLCHHFITVLTVTVQVWPGYSTMSRTSFFPSSMLSPTFHFYSFFHLALYQLPVIGVSRWTFVFLRYWCLPLL